MNPNVEKERAANRAKNTKAYKEYKKTKPEIKYATKGELNKMQKDYDKRVSVVKSKYPKKSSKKKKWYLSALDKILKKKKIIN